ncbi:MAG: sulfite exporter TauE/SafE family protein [Coriobacteriales bacterium]|jgi:sulfite exporter TauE/SafE|nr:sulfite exporter TauE/SafE family protein [Coriobacteriales bacterium]
MLLSNNKNTSPGIKTVSQSRLSRNARASGLLVIILALFLLVEQFGLLNLLAPGQLATASMSYGAIFVVGLMTSVHCLAMCGGINLSQSLGRPSKPDSSSEASGTSKLESDLDTGSASKLKSSSGTSSASNPDMVRPISPHHTNGRRFDPRILVAPALYNLGRVASYTLVGAVVGGLGSLLTLTPVMQGVLKLTAGVLMVVMGLNLMGAFPALRRFTPQPPRFLARLLAQGQDNSGSSLVVGLLNGLMPCGPLQAMQLYALATGSVAAGALSMLVFGLGTTPLIFGLGALSTLLSRRFKRVALTAGAVCVVVLGMALFVQGASLSGVFLPDWLAAGSQKTAAVDAQANQTGSVVILADGVQQVTSTLEPGRYPQITVQAGMPVRWNIVAEPNTINGCNNRFVVPGLNIEHSFAAGDNIIEFTANTAGDYQYRCWMGMIRSKITVVEAGDT